MRLRDIRTVAEDEVEDDDKEKVVQKQEKKFEKSKSPIVCVCMRETEFSQREITRCMLRDARTVLNNTYMEHTERKK